MKTPNLGSMYSNITREMAGTWNRIKGHRAQRYSRLPVSEKEPASPSKYRPVRHSRVCHYAVTLCVIAGLLGLYELFR